MMSGDDAGVPFEERHLELVGPLSVLPGVRALSVEVHRVTVTGASGAHMSVGPASRIAHNACMDRRDGDPLWTMSLPRPGVVPEGEHRQWQVDLRTEKLHQVVRAWAPCTSETDALLRLGEKCTGQLWSGRTVAQELFYRRGRPTHGRLNTNLLPNRLDGRFEIAGVTEPYPGAWPAVAIALALPDRPVGAPDFTALWPYLADAAADPLAR